MLHADRGVALLEVLVAMTILSASGLACVGLVSAGLRAEQEAREREHTVAVEDRLLAALTLLKRAELDLRLGSHALGEFVVRIQRPEPVLYRVAIVQDRSPQVEDLVTVVFRPVPQK
jgi:prepilin-type N-terminal cleavage/methylation domain-containing protein